VHFLVYMPFVGLAYNLLLFIGLNVIIMLLRVVGALNAKDIQSR
jgi:hypothetical protein